jgi:hypothetical protein
MRAKLTPKVIEVLSIYSVDELIHARAGLYKLLSSTHHIRTGLGLCSNLNIHGLVKTVTGKAFPIKGEPWEDAGNAYLRHRKLGTMYKGDQLKQRRKLAVKLIKVIDQYLEEKPD